jgi:hypothetical protein
MTSSDRNPWAPIYFKTAAARRAILITTPPLNKKAPADAGRSIGFDASARGKKPEKTVKPSPRFFAFYISRPPPQVNRFIPLPTTAERPTSVPEPAAAKRP